ncbi:hypothetical protein JG687_00015262 [Phytophthora cactorum]|uniref:RxLR effector protein n=1 Tax=Phytophthora cactorum TaxID=29920 RepID=A0A8T1TV25_9STRA|nr:hypothetical protein PC120_g20110 [Phytophthora cactorum]KAG3048110.1 hypothetical protein PC121_g19673 [Phytophthora cactorum]KAG6948769.1 hypothetical protein JG687_00015262 [Phytophthora cactorum]
MRFIQALTIPLIILLASSNAISVANPSKVSTLRSRELSLSSHPIVPGQRRSLRVDTKFDVEGENSAERGVWTYAKALWWAETGKSDAYVRKVLKLNDLDDAARKSNKYYAYFVDRTEWYQIVKWLQNDFTTFQVWKTLKLDKITKYQQLDDILDTDAFRLYMRYVKHFNRGVVSKLKNGYKPDGVMVERGASDAEMWVRALIMAQAGMKDEYAQVLLGLTIPDRFVNKLLKGDALKAHPDYKYFKLFLEAKAETRRDAEINKIRMRANA